MTAIFTPFTPITVETLSATYTVEAIGVFAGDLVTVSVPPIYTALVGAKDFWFAAGLLSK